MRMSGNQKFGFEWEKWVLRELHKRGYEDARLVSNWFADVDILLGSMPIEVKAAHPRKHWAGRCWRLRWQFDTSRVPRSVDCIIVLVALDYQNLPYPFIVPSWLVGDRYNIHITSHPTVYKGLFSPCLFRWGNVGTTKLLHDHYNGQAPLPGLGTGDNSIKSLNGDVFYDQRADPKTCPHFPIGAQL